MPHTKVMFDHFEQSVIPLLKKAGVQSMLYVGWRRDCKPWWHDYMAKELGGKLGVLEIFPRNLADLEQAVWAGRYQVDQMLAGDARYPEHVLVPGEWDVIFWDHGPEHVSAEDLKMATERLYRCAGKALLYCCPLGEWPQGMEDGNEFEIHRNSVTKEQFFDLGFTIWTCGSPGQAGEGEIVGLMGK